MGLPRSSRSRLAAGLAAQAAASSPPLRALPTGTTSTRPELRALLMHLAAERGLADNSLHAYRRDLEDLERFLEARAKNLVAAEAEDFRAYLQDQTRRG